MRADAMSKVPCFFLPKELLIDNTYCEYSLDSKIIVSIMLSYANSSDDIISAAELIQMLGKSYIDQKLTEIKKSEGEINNGV